MMPFEIAFAIYDGDDDDDADDGDEQDEDVKCVSASVCLSICALFATFMAFERQL